MKQGSRNYGIFVFAAFFLITAASPYAADEKKQDKKTEPPAFRDSWGVSAAVQGDSEEFFLEPSRLEIMLSYSAAYLQLVELGIDIRTDRGEISADDYFLSFHFPASTLRFAYDKAELFNEQLLPGKFAFFAWEGLLKEYAEIQGFLDKDYRITFGHEYRKEALPLTYSIGGAYSNATGFSMIDFSLGWKFRDENSYLNFSGVWLPLNEFFTQLSGHAERGDFAAGFEVAFGSNAVLLFLEDYSFSLLTGDYWSGLSVSGMYRFSPDKHDLRAGLKLDGLVPDVERFDRYLLRPQVATRYEIFKDLNISTGLGLTIAKYYEEFRVSPFCGVELTFKP